MRIEPGRLNSGNCRWNVSGEALVEAGSLSCQASIAACTSASLAAINCKTTAYSCSNGSCDLIPVASARSR